MTEGSGSQVHSQLMPRPWRALSPETGKPQDPGEIERESQIYKGIQDTEYRTPPSPFTWLPLFSHVTSREWVSLVSHLITTTFSGPCELLLHFRVTVLATDASCTPWNAASSDQGSPFPMVVPPPTPGTGPGTEWALSEILDQIGS